MAIADSYQTGVENSPRPRDEDTEHQRQPPPPVPPSPTLTNPDMILPYDDGERESSTPSPPFKLPSLSHLQAFYGMRQQNEPGLDPSMADAQNGAAFNRSQKKIPPRRVWMYDDAVSRRLSDIGEEEVPSPLRPGDVSGNSPVHLGGEPPILYTQVKENSPRESEGWSSSSSTISGTSERDGPEGQAPYAATRTGLGVNLHGVNEALDASSGAEADTPTSNLPQTKMMPVAEEAGPGDEFSSAILSSEAERILDNAKKRLTLMEGNLTKARSSVRLTPSPAPSSPSSGTQPLGLGQPVGGLYRSISRSDRKASAALRPRPTYVSNQDSSSNNRHSRVYSDLNLSASLPLIPSGEPKMSRSVSAMGSSTMPHYSTDERTFSYEPTRAYLTHRASISSMQPSPADKGNPPTVKEEETPPATPEPQGLGNTERAREPKISNAEEFNSVYPLSGPPSRTQSQLQVRDLQDQMKGLHIKISTLKVRAQEDGLRRRSLQSLRTPSPLAASNNWYDNDMAYKDVRNMNNTARDEPAGGDSVETSILDEGNKAPQEPVTAEATKQEDANSVATEFDDDSQSVMESLYEDAEEGEPDQRDSSGSDIDREELNEILDEPVDGELDETLEAFPPVPNHDSTPHEEREDAFDYEHFILHSALGNYTQTRLRRPSNSSVSSVETTRPYDHPSRISRSNSVTSQSTMASFATATEGERDDFESVLYWDRKFNDEMRSHDQYESDGSEDERASTPRGHSRQSNISNNTKYYHPSSPSTGSATPTALVSSLVSSVQAASSSHPGSPEKSGMNDDDTRMLEQLFQSLGTVCMDLQALTTQPEPDEKSIRVLRRRLDAARRALDGELDA